MRNGRFGFSPKLQYALAASPCEAASEHLRIPVWCRILEIARTGRAAEAAGGGAAHPAQKMPNAAKPLRSKTAKEPGKPSARTIVWMREKGILGIQDKKFDY